ncbi:MAG: hypothetical protein O7H41_17095 [Planctomycetota bacterium]|nr:hypothetical protein [Planctomycetota bacterium]
MDTRALAEAAGVKIGPVTHIEVAHPQEARYRRYDMPNTSAGEGNDEAEVLDPQTILVTASVIVCFSILDS